MGPETLGEDIQPRDVRAPVRKRINRCTGEFLKPELILIGCTNGKSREEAVLNFNHSGLGPNYIIAKDGKSESFVEARPALERIFVCLRSICLSFRVCLSLGAPDKILGGKNRTKLYAPGGGIQHVGAWFVLCIPSKVLVSTVRCISAEDQIQNLLSSRLTRPPANTDPARG